MKHANRGQGNVPKDLKKNLKATQAALNLVGVKLNLPSIKAWTPEEDKEAYSWAVATQNGAIRPRPEHVPPPTIHGFR